MGMTDALDKVQGENAIPSCMIYVDKEGAWFHKGVPIIHRGFLHLFYQSIRLDEQGRYIIKFHDQTCVLHVEDTPFVILRVTFVSRGGDEGKDRFMLHLIDGTREALDPETLTVGDDHVLYCKIRNRQFKARFSRPSYYQLAQHIQEDVASGRFYLSMDGNTYFIDTNSDSKGGMGTRDEKKA
jgi:hypothetical protein